MRAFQEMLLDEALLSTGLMELPDVWMMFNSEKVNVLLLIFILLSKSKAIDQAEAVAFV